MERTEIKKMCMAEWLRGEPYLAGDSQFKSLVKERVEVTAFDLGAARLHLGKNVARFQTELHEGITKTCGKAPLIRDGHSGEH